MSFNNPNDDFKKDCKLIKEPDNLVDGEAIKVLIDDEHVGYVANSSNTVPRGCHSGGRIYDTFADETTGIVQPTPEDMIVDPAVGTAGFLVSALQYLRDNHNDLFFDKIAYKRSRLYENWSQ